MIRQRLTRLLQPSTWLIVALVIGGCNLGMAYALDSYRRELSREYNVERSEWGKFVVDAWGLAPDLTATVVTFTLLGILAAPDAKRDERKQLQDLARKKLSGAYLTQDETVFWSRVLEESDNA